MDRGKGVEKIRGEKHKSSEAKHILGRMKSNSDFIERGQLHCDILREGRNMRKKKKKKPFRLPPIKTASPSLGPPIVGYS